MLDYFRDNWSRIEALVVERGLEKAFYPIILPEVDDARLVDARLPAIIGDYLRVARTRITNPAHNMFEGIVLKEEVQQELSPTTKIVDVTYLKKDKVYSLQCYRAEGQEGEEHLRRYLAVDLPAELSPPEKELTTVYQDLESRLQ